MDSLRGICEPRCGKVRDIYALEKHLLIVSSDRISAFDWVLPTTIADKGRILQLTTDYWHRVLNTTNDVVTTGVATMAGHDGRLACLPSAIDSLAGRTALVHKLQVIPLECVVRGYLDGSGWKEYQQSGSVCGVELPSGLQQCSQLPGGAIFTPTTKEDTGHDEPVDQPRAEAHLQAWLSHTFGTSSVNKPWSVQLFAAMSELSINLYERGARIALDKCLIIADTKFEFAIVPEREGRLNRDNWQLCLIDEVLKPDSSRYWPADEYEPRRSQNSYDKQIVRDWLANTAKWDKDSEPPALPNGIVQQARERYIQLFELLTEENFVWK
jgi:phosphoribosylaminoimidazole-succinocarboxamide synthase